MPILLLRGQKRVNKYEVAKFYEGHTHALLVTPRKKHLL